MKKKREIAYELIPPHMKDSVKRYVEGHKKPGHFLYAVLCNDFVSAACYSDSINRQNLHSWALFLVNQLPRECWGSQKDVERWLRKDESI